MSRTFAVHVEGESDSPNLRELTDNYLQTIRASSKTVVRTATFSEHATSAAEGESTLQAHEIAPTLSEQQLFEQGHRVPAQPPAADETSDEQSANAVRT